MRSIAWRWLISGLALGLLLAAAAYLLLPPPPQPDPGPIIVITPDPDPSGNYWSIAGSLDCEDQLQVNDYLSAKAFGKKLNFYTRAVVNGTLKKVNPDELTARFRHCTAAKLTRCDQDSDCPAGETCQTSELLVQLEKLGANPPRFAWILNGTRLQPTGNIGDDKWRAELCGRLDGPIEIAWLDSAGQLQQAQVPSGQSVTIQSEP